jgi:hypothetical protein
MVIVNVCLCKITAACLPKMNLDLAVRAHSGDLANCCRYRLRRRKRLLHLLINGSRAYSWIGRVCSYGHARCGYSLLLLDTILFHFSGRIIQRRRDHWRNKSAEQVAECKCSIRQNRRTDNHHEYDNRYNDTST